MPSSTLLKAFEEQEKIRRQLLKKISVYNADQQLYRPGGESWNMTDVCRHLIEAETNGLKYLQKKMQGGSKLPGNDFKAKFRILFLNVMLKLPLKFKAPKAASIPLDKTATFDEVLGQWDFVRSEWRKFLENFPPELEGKLLFKHPVAGMFTIEQTLSFIGNHIQHHYDQIDRIASSKGFPA